MFLSGTFGLSEGVALYPTESVKDELWSTWRRVTDLTFSVDAIREALQGVADVFKGVVDPSPSSAGTALTVAVDPTLVSFDMLRTALHLHLERAGVPSASLSTTLDKIQRHQAKIVERGGNVTRVEMTFFLPAEGYTISPFGTIRSESLDEAKAHADRADEETKRTEREIKATEKQERVAELAERSLKDKEIVGTKAELVDVRTELVEKQTEIEKLRERIAELEAGRAKKDEEARVAEDTFRELQAAEVPELERATEEVREARREGVERAQEGLDERAPERAGVTQEDVARAVERQVEEEVLRKDVAIPFFPEEIVALPPEQRAEKVVPVVRPVVPPAKPAKPAPVKPQKIAPAKPAKPAKPAPVKPQKIAPAKPAKPAKPAPVKPQKIHPHPRSP